MVIGVTDAPPDALLQIYLNDHLAGSRAGIELARRIQSHNRGTALGEAFTALRPELGEDRRALESLIADLGFRRNPVKEAGAWAIERVSRLKLNGQLVGYSSLSRLIELEALCSGVDAKHSLWTSLERIAAERPEVRAIDPTALADRATRHRRILEEHRLDAAARALTTHRPA